MAISPEAVIGVDAGGTKVTLAAVYDGGIDKDTFERYDTPSDSEEFVYELGTRVVALSQRTGIKIVSAGIPGGVQWEGETSVSFGPVPNIKGFNAENFKKHGPFDLVGLLGDEVPKTKELKIVYFNDAHIVGQAAVRLLTPPGYKNDEPHGTILVSTGIGGEFLVNYRPIFSDRNVLGEYGHVGIGDPSVSLENLSSGTAIKARYGVDPKDLDEDYSPLAEGIWKETGENLAAGFGNLLAVFNPDHLAFVGSMAAGGFHRFGPYFNSRMSQIAWAGRAHNLKVPEQTPVTRELLNELPLRGTIWAYQGLRPLPV